MAAAPRMDAPPPPPPDVTAQTGAMSRIGSAMNRQGGGGPVGPSGEMASVSQAHPQGAILAQADAIEKLLRQMSRMNEGFAPYANRMAVVLRNGLAQALEGAQATPFAPTPQLQAPGSTNRPPAGEAAEGFPG